MPFYLHPDSKCDASDCLKQFELSSSSSSTGPLWPYSTSCGHVLCSRCYIKFKNSKCPVCSKKLNPSHSRKLPVTSAILEVRDISVHPAVTDNRILRNLFKRFVSSVCSTALDEKDDDMSFLDDVDSAFPGEKVRTDVSDALNLVRSRRRDAKNVDYWEIDVLPTEIRDDEKLPQLSKPDPVQDQVEISAKQPTHVSHDDSGTIAISPGRLSLNAECDAEPTNLAVGGSDSKPRSAAAMRLQDLLEVGSSPQTSSLEEDILSTRHHVDDVRPKPSRPSVSPSESPISLLRYSPHAAGEMIIDSFSASTAEREIADISRRLLQELWGIVAPSPRRTASPLGTPGHSKPVDEVRVTLDHSPSPTITSDTLLPAWNPHGSVSMAEPLSIPTPPPIIERKSYRSLEHLLASPLVIRESPPPAPFIPRRASLGAEDTTGDVDENENSATATPGAVALAAVDNSHEALKDVFLTSSTPSVRSPGKTTHARGETTVQELKYDTSPPAPEFNSRLASPHSFSPSPGRTEGTLIEDLEHNELLLGEKAESEAGSDDSSLSGLLNSFNNLEGPESTSSTAHEVLTRQKQMLSGFLGD